MQESTAAGFDEEFPQLNAAVTLYHAAALLALEFGRPQPNTFPDSGMNPAAIGSEFQAYE